MQGPTERELLQALRTNTLAPSSLTEEMIALYECKPGEQSSENVWLHTSASVNLAFVQALFGSANLPKGFHETANQAGLAYAQEQLLILTKSRY